MKKEKCINEMLELGKLKAIVTQSLGNAPDGRMRSEMAQGKYPQFYAIREDEMKKCPKGIYIRKADISLAKAYAQKEYDIMMLEAIEKREKELNFIMHANEQSEIHSIFGKLSQAKRTLIEPYVLNDIEFISQWEKNHPGEENRYPISEGFLTEKGETVRSKSEKIIADKLYMQRIPYKYEKKLVLKSNKLIYPDFTILNYRTREELYLEHFGMMDNPEYCKAAIEKLELYEDNGIYLGDRLLITIESSLKPISVKRIDNLIEKYFR